MKKILTIILCVLISQIGVSKNTYSTNIQFQYDLEIQEIDFEDMIFVGDNNVTGLIRNNGTQAITSFDLHYSINNGERQSMTISNVYLSPNVGTYEFIHDKIWKIPSNKGGVFYDLCVSIDNINGDNTVDENSDNNIICKNLFTATGNSGNRKVLIEEFTGAWCGFCPDGEIIVDNIIASHPNDAISVSIHSGDDMEITNDIISSFNVTSYPSGMVNRVLFFGQAKEPHSRNLWSNNVNSQTGFYTPGDISVSTSYDTSTSIVNITLTSTFTDFLTGDVRMIPMVVEDNVTGSGSGYDQVNYYNNDASHHFYNAGNPIVGYVHKRVLRALPSGGFGNPNVISNTVSPGDVFTESFQYTVPAGYNFDELSVIGVLAKYSTALGQRYVLNVNDQHLLTGTETIRNQLTNVNLYPNPIQNHQFQFELEKNNLEVWQLEIYNLMGQRIYDKQIIDDNTTVQLPLELPSGQYFYSLKNENGQRIANGLLTL